MPPTTEEVRPSYLTMQSPSPATATSVVVHPLVLLSVTDHASRMAISARKRVVGVLLGQDMGKTINVANSFAVPFEEDESDPKTLFLDHNYIYGMLEMFKKVNGTLCLLTVQRESVLLAGTTQDRSCARRTWRSTT